MPYKSRIKALREEFENLTQFIDKQRKIGTELSNLGEIVAKRTNLYEEIVRLNRLQWEEDNERTNLDDDH